VNGNEASHGEEKKKNAQRQRKRNMLNFSPALPFHIIDKILTALVSLINMPRSSSRSAVSRFDVVDVTVASTNRPHAGAQNVLSISKCRPKKNPRPNLTAALTRRVHGTFILPPNSQRFTPICEFDAMPSKRKVQSLGFERRVRPRREEEREPDSASDDDASDDDGPAEERIEGRDDEDDDDGSEEDDSQVNLLP
jgi:hypothetical protein